MSPTALLELEEKAQELVPVEAARELVDDIYRLDVSTWVDSDFAALERVIDKAIQVISALPTSQHRPLIERLLEARNGVEQGMSPDPTKRPTAEDLAKFVAAHL